MGLSDGLIELGWKVAYHGLIVDDGNFERSELGHFVCLQYESSFVAG